MVAEEEWDYIVCTSKNEEGYGNTGRITFVSEISGVWYLVTPHPYHYRVVDSCPVEQAVVSFLAQQRSSVGQPGELHVNLQGKLIQIDYEEYEQALGHC